MKDVYVYIYILFAQMNSMDRAGIISSLRISIVILVLLALALNLVIVIGMNLTGFSRVSGDFIDDTGELIADTGDRLVPEYIRNSEDGRGEMKYICGNSSDVWRRFITKQISDGSIPAIEGTTYWIDKGVGVVAIDPSGMGGAVTSASTISINGIGFEYSGYTPFVLVSDDGVPSMVLIFGQGSIKSTLYMDNDAKELLDSPDSKIEIVGSSSVKVDESDIRKAEDMDLYLIEVRNSDGGANLKGAFEHEIKDGGMVIYPQISGVDSEVMGSKVLVDEYEDIGFFEISSLSDFFLWINLKFGMNLNNEEKEVLQNGILETLEEAVEANRCYVPLE